MRWCSCHKQSMMVRWDRVSVLTQQKFTYPSGINGTMEISFDVPTFADVDKEYEHAIGMGAKPIMEPTTEPWGQRTCYVADPEGNLIEISSFNESGARGV